MKIIVFLIFTTFYPFVLHAEDSIRIIELHAKDILKLEEINIIDNNTEELIEGDSVNIPNPDSGAENILNNEETNIENNINNNEDHEDNNKDSNDNNNEDNEGNEDKSEETTTEVSTVPELWQNTKKDDLDFLFKNLQKNRSKVLTNLLMEKITEYAIAPNQFSQSEFDNLRINTLFTLDQRQSAINLLNEITTYKDFQDQYDLLKLNYYFSSNDLTEACDFKESLQESINDKNNLVLKTNIFCSLIQNKKEEADFLNSLLLDTNNSDEYFQKIYFNLKNDSKENIKLNTTSLNNDTLALYSAMLRIGNLPLNNHFLEYDPSNLALPIVLSSSSDILLRLKAAHIAYDLKLFDSDSLSALYQSLDFSYSQLNDSKKFLKNFEKKPEMGMALLYQKANVQILPITRLESLREFWDYAKVNNLESLSYEISKSLIAPMKPSEELSDFSLDIARAHINNKNYLFAKQWIVFAEKYITENEKNNRQELNSIKLLYDLSTSANYNDFITTLIENKVFEKKGYSNSLNETLSTILASIMSNEELDIEFSEIKRLTDERTMPSRYILEKINNSANLKKMGELILTINVSLNGKYWSDVHPHHLKIILDSLNKTELKYLFKNLIIEILKESKII